MLSWVWRLGNTGRRRGCGHLFLMVFPLLLLAGCGRDTGAARTPVTTGLPRFEPGECGFSGDRWSGFECGYLVVPENRDQAGGPNIRLRVARIRSGAESPESDPLIYLTGGPGQSAVEWFSEDVEQFQTILRQRDIIYFDQRGTGYSEPDLACPEVSEYRSARLEPGSGTDDPAQDRADTYLACRQRLAGEGIDLAAYNSAASAADVNDLRQVLGYDQVNLLGVSYGSRLALTVMRDFPDAIRSVILDSPLPLQIDLVVGLGSTLQASLDLVLERCAADDACAAAYPDLVNTLDELLARLDQEPLVIQAPHPLTGSSREVTVDGDAFMTGLVFSLYSRDDIYHLPKLISDIYHETPNYEERLANLVQLPNFGLSHISEGQRYSVLCYEEVPFYTEEAVLAQTAEVNPWLRAGVEEDMRADSAICDGWDVDKAPAIENEPVHSDVPTLVLTGEFDPVTPPSFGDLVAETLSNASHVVFPYTSHSVYFNRLCARQLATAFVDDPAAPLDLSCVEALHDRPPEFATN